MGPDPVSNQIIGLVPFSYVATDRFQMSRDHEDEAAMLKALFDESRIGFRFRLLEMINARCFREQTDSDFTLIYLVAEKMPAEHRARLEKIVEGIRGVRIVALPQMPLADAVRTAFETEIRPGTDHVTLFRLDDDDALALDYVATLRRRACQLVRAGMAKKPTVVSWTRGIYWRIDGKKSQLIDICDRVPLSMGYAIVSPADEIGHHYLKGHRDAAMFYPCVMDPTRAMYIRSVHGDNDGGQSNLDRGRTLGPKQAEGLMKRRFGLDAATLLAPPADLGAQTFSQRLASGRVT